MNPLRRFASDVLDLVYPPACLVCDAALPADLPARDFCGDCSAIRHDSELTCPRCSSTIGPHVDASAGCPRCRDEKYQFESATRLGAYGGALRGAVLRMKFAAGEPLAEILGRELGKKLFGAWPVDAVVPIPLFWLRRWKRGYNQSAAVAFGVAGILGVPCRPRLLRRTRDTPSQSTQSPTGRRENVRGAFVVRAGRVVRGLRVLLIDDVLTTGATVNEAARVLKAAGAAQVRAAVIAHR